MKKFLMNQDRGIQNVMAIAVVVQGKQVGVKGVPLFHCNLETQLYFPEGLFSAAELQREELEASFSFFDEFTGLIDQFIPLRNAMEEHSPKLEKDLDKLKSELSSIYPNPQDPKEVKISPINDLRGFLTQVQKSGSKYSEAVMATTEGKEAFEEILQHYNAIAQWLGFPPLSKKS